MPVCVCVCVRSAHTHTHTRSHTHTHRHPQATLCYSLQPIISSTGHDHNMQHLQKLEDPDYFDFLISGAGGSGLFDEEIGYDDILLDQYNIALKSMHVIGAFAAIEATSRSLNVTFVDLNADIIYSYTRTRSDGAKTSL